MKEMPQNQLWEISFDEITLEMILPLVDKIYECFVFKAEMGVCCHKLCQIDIGDSIN